jgi:hypothetical protein
MSEWLTGTAARINAHPLFSYGFRPFFLGAGAYAVVVMGIWVCWLSTGMPGWTFFGSSPIAWHAHEMIFGLPADRGPELDGCPTALGLAIDPVVRGLAIRSCSHARGWVARAGDRSSR